MSNGNISEMAIYRLMEHNINGGYKCSICECVMSAKRNMFYHVESKHLKSPEGYKCKLCFKFCGTLKALDIHNNRFHNLKIGRSSIVIEDTLN